MKNVSLNSFFLFSKRKLHYIIEVFNIINRKTLLSYWKEYPIASSALQEWYYELSKHDFSNFNELRNVYGSVSIVGDDRVVFNILGNHFRLVIRIVFNFKTIQIKWFGTHAEFDNFDVNKIKFKKK